MKTPKQNFGICIKIVIVRIVSNMGTLVICTKNIKGVVIFPHTVFMAILMKMTKQAITHYAHSY